ncbi:MAG: DNA glycosylase [Clostridia bacterium]
MITEFTNDSVILKGVFRSDLDLRDTFSCGQCFRWDEDIDTADVFTGIAYGKFLKLIQRENEIELFTDKTDFHDIWEEYFDLKTDYDSIKETLRTDDIMNKAISEAPGIRILRQELFETIISFITSSNSNIKRTRKNISALSALFGEPVEEGTYAFPSVRALSEADICEINGCRAGFRCGYISESAKYINNEPDTFEISNLMNMGYEGSKKALKRLKGVGNKVADCIILFSGISGEAFPTDVWVKRIMENLYIKKEVSQDYIEKYGREKFGDLAGYAQQYLFYYARNLKMQ